MADGKIVQCIGAVVDVEFPRNAMPKVFDALKMDGSELTLEVQQQLGDGIVRTIALGSSQGLRRGMIIKNTGNPIMVPVGTATLGRISGFGGAPNMGADARGRRHVSPAWLKAGAQARQGRGGVAAMPRGQKLVVQIVETFREHMQPAFVDKLDAWQLAEQAGMEIPPVMIYGDDVTHILTEEGIANLLLCRSDEEREQAIRGVAGYTPIGLGRDRRMVENLRDRGVIRRAQDLGIDQRDATRNLLAARSMRDLVRASGGLYQPPRRFRNW